MNVEEREMYDFANILIHSAGTKLKQEHKRSVIKVREKHPRWTLLRNMIYLLRNY